MTKHFNKLTPAEDERLALLAGECAEVIQIIAKIQRHGYESRWPKDGLSNREMLEIEMGHVINALDILAENYDVSRNRIDEQAEAKRQTINQWLHHNKVKL